MKILIIDDDADTVEVIRLSLQLRWPEVELVSSQRGGKGVDMVKSERPDLVVLDLGLPDLNGFEVLKQMRLFSSVPVLILTVFSGEGNKVKGLEYGADDYMVKPFGVAEFLARVKVLTGRTCLKIVEESTRRT